VPRLKDKKKNLKQPKNADPEFEEFEKTMLPRSKKGPSWADNVEQPQPGTSTSVPEDVVQKASAPKEPPDDNGEEKQEGVSDLDWMRQRMKRNLTVSEEKAFEQSDEEGDDEEIDPQVSKDPIAEIILQTARLFVRNLTFSCTESDLLELFKPFGEISQVHIPIDSTTKQAKGVAYVTFAKPDQALAAYQSLDKKSFQGHLYTFLELLTARENFR